MKADFEYDGTDVELIMNMAKTALVIRCQTVDQLPAGPQRSGKYLHLTLTSKHAMRLLSMLQAAQQQMNLPGAEPASSISVPPAKERN